MSANIAMVAGGQFIASVVDGAFGSDPINGWRLVQLYPVTSLGHSETRFLRNKKKISYHTAKYSCPAIKFFIYIADLDLHCLQKVMCIVDV